MARFISLVLLCLLVYTHTPAQSPYIDKVYDFVPAPGQFTNALPQYKTGDTKDDMIRKAEEAIARNKQGMISLGGFGGYVVFGFDHMVENVAGKYDFKILGNAFYSEANPNGDASREGGSCEPGIVMVSHDANGNGKPDDPWYELAGSEYNRPGTVKNYEITYYKPDEAKTPTPDNTYTDGSGAPYLTDTTYVKWTDNRSSKGHISRNMYNTQPYYPQWLTEEQLVFRGTKLADNFVDESGRRKYYVGYAYHWGYADNHPDSDDRSGFNIEWAVDANGKKVSLPGIHFVKVYTGVNQYNGWIGEVSTEILGAEDLHLTGRSAVVPVFTESVALNKSSAVLKMGETLTLTATVMPANATNRKITWKSSIPGVATVKDGLVTPLAGGTTTIQAITNDGYYIASCTVTVQAEGTGAIPVERVTLNETSLSLNVNETYLLNAVIYPANATNQAVRWESSDPQIVEVTVNGLLFAIAPGKAVITVITEENSHKATLECTVATGSPIPVEKIETAKPIVGYSEGQVRLSGLDGFRCTIYNLSGQILHTFAVQSGEESHALSLPTGLYILSAKKGATRIPFKLRITKP